MIRTLRTLIMTTGVAAAMFALPASAGQIHGGGTNCGKWLIHHKAAGNVSLVRWAERHGSNAYTVILTTSGCDTGTMATRFGGYIDQGNLRRPVPEGIELWTLQTPLQG